MWLRPRSTNAFAIATNGSKMPLESDSHTNTTCLGRGALTIFDYECPVNVQECDPALDAKEYHTVSGALAYIQSYTGVRYHLIIHQAVHMPDLGHHLLCPMQCRANAVQVNDCPCIYCKNPTEESQAMMAQDEYGDTVNLPFFLSGVTSHVNVESLSRDELERHVCPWITLTNANQTWDPSASTCGDQENAMLDYKGENFHPNSTVRGPLMVVNLVCMSIYEDAADILSDDNFAAVIQHHVNISHVNMTHVNENTHPNVPEVS